MNTIKNIEENNCMKKSTKILFILFLVFFIASVIMTKYVIRIVRIEEGTLAFRFDTYSIIGLVLIGGSVILGNILYFKFLFSLAIDKVLFFTTIPLMILYGFSLFMLAQIDRFDSDIALYIKNILNITDNSVYNLILWAVILSIVFILFVLFNYALICRPIAKVERIVSRLGDGFVREEKFSIGGGRQFENIEDGLNKINDNYKERSGVLDIDAKSTERKISRQLYRFLGRDAIYQIQRGESIKKDGTIMSVKLIKEKEFSSLSLEENYDIISSYIKLISPLVSKYSGFIDKYYGDKIIAVFPRNDNALACSYLISKSIHRQNRLNKSFTTIFDQISLTAGELVFGLKGEDEKSPTIVSGVIDILGKIEEIGRFISAEMILSKEVIDNLPLNYTIKNRYVGSIKIDDRRKLLLYEDLNVYPRDVAVKLRRIRDSFECGVRNFENGNYLQSNKMFEQIMKIYPNDKVTYLYYNKTKEKLLKEN